MTHHHHDHGTKISLSFDEKMIKLLEHWIKHNEDHAKTYRDWAKKAKEKNKREVALLIEDAAEMALLINKKFEAAVKLVEKE